MQRLALGILVGLTICAGQLASAQDKDPVKVFLLGGQSNMVGIAPASELKPPYDKPPANVTVWSPREQKWVPLSPEVVNSRGLFGPEISFGHAIAAALPGEDVRLVKYAASGTALYNDWAPTDGKQYQRFMVTVKPALANLEAAGTKYEVAGMMWLQGESDAAERKGDTYEANLTAFIAHMREQFAAPEMPFIIARVLNEYGRKSGHATLVRDAQVKVAADTQNVECFDTDDLPPMHPKNNRGHYNGVGLIEIGKRFAKGYAMVKE